MPRFLQIRQRIRRPCRRRFRRTDFYQPVIGRHGTVYRRSAENTQPRNTPVIYGGDNAVLIFYLDFRCIALFILHKRPPVSDIRVVRIIFVIRIRIGLAHGAAIPVSAEKPRASGFSRHALHSQHDTLKVILRDIGFISRRLIHHLDNLTGLRMSDILGRLRRSLIGISAHKTADPFRVCAAVHFTRHDHIRNPCDRKRHLTTVCV